MSARGDRSRGVVGAKRVLDNPTTHSIDGRYAVFSIDEEVLPADRTANFGGKLCWLANVHRVASFLGFAFVAVIKYRGLTAGRYVSGAGRS